MFFIVGILIGGVITFSFLSNPIIINEDLRTELTNCAITNSNGMLPREFFSLENPYTLKGFLMVVVSGFMIGFGSCYAGGYRSVYSISIYQICNYHCYLLLFRWRTNNSKIYSAIYTFPLAQ